MPGPAGTGAAAAGASGAASTTPAAAATSPPPPPLPPAPLRRTEPGIPSLLAVRGRALFVAVDYIDSYASNPAAAPPGRESAAAVGVLLSSLRAEGFTGTARVLSDDGDVEALPTKQNIMRGARWLAEGTRAGDGLLLVYAGKTLHGGHKEQGGSGRLVPADFQECGSLRFLDVLSLVSQLMHAEATLLVVCDSFHQGYPAARLANQLLAYPEGDVRLGGGDGEGDDEASAASAAAAAAAAASGRPILGCGGPEQVTRQVARFYARKERLHQGDPEAPVAVLDTAKNIALLGLGTQRDGAAIGGKDAASGGGGGGEGAAAAAPSKLLVCAAVARALRRLRRSKSATQTDAMLRAKAALVAEVSERLGRAAEPACGRIDEELTPYDLLLLSREGFAAYAAEVGEFVQPRHLGVVQNLLKKHFARLELIPLSHVAAPALHDLLHGVRDELSAQAPPPADGDDGGGDGGSAGGASSRSERPPPRLDASLHLPRILSAPFLPCPGTKSVVGGGGGSGGGGGGGGAVVTAAAGGVFPERRLAQYGATPQLLLDGLGTEPGPGPGYRAPAGGGLFPGAAVARSVPLRLPLKSGRFRAKAGQFLMKTQGDSGAPGSGRVGHSLANPLESGLISQVPVATTLHEALERVKTSGETAFMFRLPEAADGEQFCAQRSRIHAYFTASPDVCAPRAADAVLGGRGGGAAQRTSAWVSYLTLACVAPAGSFVRLHQGRDASLLVAGDGPGVPVPGRGAVDDDEDGEAGETLLGSGGGGGGRGGAADPEALREQEMRSRAYAEARVRLFNFYQVHNHKKLPVVTATVKEFRNKIDSLFAVLVKKYGAEPEAATAEVLPAGWCLMESPEGDLFYRHEDGRSQWVRPTLQAEERLLRGARSLLSRRTSAAAASAVDQTRRVSRPLSDGIL